MRLKGLLRIYLLLAGHSIHAQCMLLPVSLEERVNSAQLVIEGKVISQQSYWDIKKHNIYTVNRVNIYKAFKGNPAGSMAEIITEGGIVDNTMQQVTSSLVLNNGAVGMFTLTPSNLQLEGFTSSASIYEVYAGLQGFIQYDLTGYGAHAVFDSYNDVAHELYPSLQNITQQEFKEIRKTDWNVTPASVRTPLAPSITDFTPSTVSAGTKNLLTINGSGFGSSQGASNYVEFKNSDDGGGSYVQPLASEYVSWNDTKIEVNVPAKAGTGIFRVVNSSQTGNASSSLTVSYANLNANSSNVQYLTDHVNKSGGGYMWQMNTSFDTDNNAKTAFRRAFESWRCGTYINWSLGSTTSVDVVASDGINIIMFENPSQPMSAGVLGRCTSWWIGCNGATVWYVTELDIQFDNAASWYYGTGSPGLSFYDFESVALHELGHGHQLGHVIKATDVMHYSISKGQFRRVLSADDQDGANLVMSRSVVDNACGPGKMTALTAGNCSLSDNTQFFNFVPGFSLYPNPAAGKLNIELETEASREILIEIVNALGVVVYTDKIKVNQYYRNELDVSFLHDGIYLFRVNSGNNWSVQKMIISK